MNNVSNAVKIKKLFKRLDLMSTHSKELIWKNSYKKYSTVFA